MIWDVTSKDNSEVIKDALKTAYQTALRIIGEKAERYAKIELSKKTKTGGGSSHLRNSITWAISGNDVYIGSNLHYAPYVELGTGRFAEGGGGRRGWWVYVEDSDGSVKGRYKEYTREEAERAVAYLRAQGLPAHMTEGMTPRPYLRPAAYDHKDEYREILKKCLEDG